MTDQPTNYRWQRIQRLLEQELQYEVVRGMIEGDVDETLNYEFVVPVSKTFPNGTVLCSFTTRPVPYSYTVNYAARPRLKVVT